MQSTGTNMRKRGRGVAHLLLKPTLLCCQRVDGALHALELVRQRILGRKALRFVAAVSLAWLWRDVARHLTAVFVWWCEESSERSRTDLINSRPSPNAPAPLPPHHRT